jgi:hypothetical protein
MRWRVDPEEEHDDDRHARGYVRVYDSVAEAEAEDRLAMDLHTEAHLTDAYDAAVVERRAGGMARIVAKHETPARVGGVLVGGVAGPEGREP